MPNPYADLPASAFWKRAIAEHGDGLVRAIPADGPRLSHNSRLATAGSCFAQNVARHLRRSGRITFLETEPLRGDDPVFSGRYGNIYTARQLVQLFDEWRSGRPDPDCAIRRHDGRFVDIHRPLIEAAGFATAEEVATARAAHVAAIGPAFTDCDLFVFTLGLTEVWLRGDGRARPVCPGIYSDDPVPYSFHNFSFLEVLADMEAFLDRLAQVNPAARVLLTVSPVPLTATASGEHVLTATAYSKAVLRAVCGELLTRRPGLFYFPSFEMIANPHLPGTAYEANRRTVRADAIAEVMALFESLYLTDPAPIAAPNLPEEEDEVFCDEVAIEKSLGF